jgi:hypothetical protein
MIRKNFSSVIALGIILAFLFTANSLAQPLSKRNYKLSLKGSNAQTLVPVNYISQNKIGPLSKISYKHSGKNKSAEEISSNFVRESSKVNFFLQQKRQNALYAVNNKLNSAKEIKFAGIDFSKQRRHQ